MLYVLVIRLLLFACKILLNSVESKLILGCCHGNESEINNIQSQTTMEQKLSKNGPNIKLSNNLNNVSQTNLNFWEICHLTFIKKYEYILVYVININYDFFKHKHMYNELGLVQLYTTVETSRTSKAVIIFISVLDELRRMVNSKTTFWNQDSILVIVVMECLLLAEVKFEMEALWKYHKVYKYVLLCGKQNPSMYIYRPFVENGKNRIFEVEDKTEISDNIVHAVDNLYGSIVRIVLFPQDFFAITNNGKYIGGVDYSPLQILQKKMNFQPLISLPTDGNKFTQAGKNITGSVRDIVLGIADIALNGHFLIDYGTDLIVLSRYVYMDKLCFIVPMPPYNSPYSLIVQIFPKSIWALIVLVYFTTIIIYYIFEIFTVSKHRTPKLDNLWLQIFALFIFGATSLKINSTPKKLLLGGLLLNILIINNVFQGSLLTVLSKPTRKQPMETFDQVLKSDLVLVSKNVEGLIDDPKLLQSLSRLQERKISKDNNFVRIQRFPVSHVHDYHNHLRYRKNNVTELLHIVSEYIKSDLVSFVLPKNSPLLDRINLYLMRFQESGLTGKWLGRDVSLMIRKMYKPLKEDELETTQARSFTLNDLTFIFTLLFIGLGLSTIVFFCEKVLGNT